MLKEIKGYFIVKKFISDCNKVELYFFEVSTIIETSYKNILCNIYVKFKKNIDKIFYKFVTQFFITSIFTLLILFTHFTSKNIEKIIKN